MKPGEVLSYSVESPIDHIILPERKGIFIAWHGPKALIANVSTGTVYSCREDDNDSLPLNFDVYSIQPTNDPNLIKIVPFEHQTYHWSKDVPDFMKESVPDWVKKRIEEIKKKVE